MVSSPQPPMALLQAAVGWWDVLALQNSWIHQKALEDASAKPRGAWIALEQRVAASGETSAAPNGEGMKRTQASISNFQADPAADQLDPIS